MNYRDASDAIGFVYVWINRINGRYYIGSHRGYPDDGYVSSGVAILAAIKKYGIENFDRVIDYIGPDFREEETKLIEFFDAINCPLGYNIMHMHQGGASISPEARRKLSEGRKGMVFTKETRLKMSAAKKGKPRDDIKKMMTGRKLSDETCRKMSESRTGLVPWNKGLRTKAVQ